MSIIVNSHGSPDLSPTDLKKDSGVIIIDQTPTPQEEAEETFDNPDEKHKHLKNKSLEQDIKERRRYAVFAFRLTKTWVCFIISVTVIQFIARLFDKGLNNIEYITVITTTTASVFGFWALVGRYLFNSTNGHKKNLKTK